MRIPLIIAAGAAALSIVSTPASANHGKGGSHWRNGHSYRHCPPGLARKHNGCLAPGQAKHRWARGDRVPDSWRYVDYTTLPEYYRTRYPVQDGRYYYYSNNNVYVVDPTTHLIDSIVNILR